MAANGSQWQRHPELSWTHHLLLFKLREQPEVHKMALVVVVDGVDIIAAPGFVLAHLVDHLSCSPDTLT